MPGFRVETWQDEHGTVWELLVMDLDGTGDACIIREPMSRLDLLDGDGREGAHVVARFGDAEAARAFLWTEGFEPRV